MHYIKANKLYTLFASLVLLAFIGQKAEAQTDALYYDLDSTTVYTEIHSSSIKKISALTTQIDIGMIQDMPKILGNTDPVTFIKNLPGVQTGTEYDSGIHIHGCDNSHNEISLGGVPLYGVNHLFGLFSIFNPSHFSKMNFSKNSERNWLGGSLDMELPDTLRKNFVGDLSVGIMSSQGTLGIITGKKSHLRLSVRQSYMNLLYKRWLKIEGSPIRYGFGDYNLSWMSDITERDRIWVEGYFGQDKALVNEHKFAVSLDLDWGNHAGALHWRHIGDEVFHHHTLFYSGHDSYGIMTQNESFLSLSSYIKTAGYKGNVKWRKISGDIEINFHDIMPQSPETGGLYERESGSPEKQKAFESLFLLGYNTTLKENWNIEAKLRTSLFINSENQYDISASPDISISYNAYHLGKITYNYGWRRQYLLQTGVTNIGLPIEFWFAAGKHSLPQISHNMDLTYDVNLLNDALSLSAGLYYKRLFNQIEYKGDMFDFFTSVYDLDKHLLKGDGWNYGANFMIHKQTGDMTGWISYSVGRALRRFDNPNYSGIYPSNHERIHELNAVCSYNLNKWNLSGTFIFASGIPFTAPEYYYISSGQIITKLGEHNACRMRPYIRLDFSASYSFNKTKDKENGINFSLYNVTGRSNDIMYRLNAKDGVYSYRQMAFFLRWVPSISYYHKF